MPWKDLPPEWVATNIEALRDSEFWTGLKTFAAAILAAGVGVMAKVADEVKRGERRKFFSAQLWLEIPTLIMSAIITVGVAAFYALPGPVAGAAGVIVGYAGTKLVDTWLAHRLRR